MHHRVWLITFVSFIYFLLCFFPVRSCCYTVIALFQSVITAQSAHKRLESNNKAVTPFFHSHSDSDKDQNISAGFEVADASLALISLGHYSWGRPSDGLGRGSFPLAVSWLDFVDFKLFYRNSCLVCSIVLSNLIYLQFTWQQQLQSI